jgi:hypothetical protein
MLQAFTLRYINDDGAIVRLAVKQCASTDEALRWSSQTMKDGYASVEISLEDQFVWSGSKKTVEDQTLSPVAQDASNVTRLVSRFENVYGIERAIARWENEGGALGRDMSKNALG